MKKWILWAFLFGSSYLSAQSHFSKQFSLITDNDLYTSINRDKYYTSGIFLSYKYASKKLKKDELKRIYEWKIAHEMYTPQKAVIQTLSEHDRPFAAYLYGGFGITRAFEKSILQTDLELGFIGPNAFGKEMQDFIHDIYGFRRAVGWKYQIEGALGLNLDLTYIKDLHTSSTKTFDVSWMNSGSVGTVFTNIATGLYSRIGLNTLQRINNSMAFDTHLQRSTQKREIESFLFINPMIRYAFYDATLEGSFLNPGSPITNELTPLVFHLQVGLLFSANRFNFGYVYHFETKKSEGLVHDHGNIYGTIRLHYLFN